MIESYPLHWPQFRKRTVYRRSSKFELEFGRARDAALRELRLLGASNIVISTNLPTRRDGPMEAELVNAAYRKLAHSHHPDRGGSAERMAEVNAAYAEAMKTHA